MITAHHYLHRPPGDNQSQWDVIDNQLERIRTWSDHTKHAFTRLLMRRDRELFTGRAVIEDIDVDQVLLPTKEEGGLDSRRQALGAAGGLTAWSHVGWTVVDTPRVEADFQRQPASLVEWARLGRQLPKVAAEGRIGPPPPSLAASVAAPLEDNYTLRAAKVHSRSRDGSSVGDALSGCLPWDCRVTLPATRRYVWGPRVAGLHCQTCEPSSGRHSPRKNAVGLSSSGAATEAANDGGGGPIPPSAAIFGSFARQRSTPAINRQSINWTSVTHR
ncbi:hypothetical protein PCASD_03163 [Puccinia coronata f. sp. avenae]|uniref:Uncharacterized protein n=1 Tax=Puccinia coronata f. sp. avenae TaxID=200324 RepID=A0A2N5VFE2_9BASI|nr:hypothetical protein PCASD_03163 [Puccinia coronata f. sp. avenae]